MDPRGQERVTKYTIGLREKSRRLSYGSSLTHFNTFFVHKSPGDSSTYAYKLVCFRIIFTVLLLLTFINLNFSIKFTNV